MENQFLNQKRERPPSEIKEEEDLFSKDNPQKKEKIIDVNFSKNDLLLNSKNEIQENNENNDKDDISELIFQLNTKTSGVICSICKKDLSKNIKFLCSECDNKIFCIKCLILKKHSPEHKFQVIDKLNFSLFTEDWSVKDEYNLLHNLSISGLNNWEDISNILNKGQTDCEAHYYSFYYIDKENPLPQTEDIILDEKKKILEDISSRNQTISFKKTEEINKSNAHSNSYKEPIKEIKPNKRAGRYIGLRKNLKPGEAETAAEILGCRPKRHEFETEFLNDTEIEISHLEFDDKDKEDDLNIKYDVLRDYNLRIKEREERKNFVFEKGLLDLRRENRIESKLNRDQYELLLFLKTFARFYENSDFFDLFEGICLEQELKMVIKNLNKIEKEKAAKGEKINSLEDLENWFNMQKKSGKRNIQEETTNNPLKKNPRTYLGHRLDRFMTYDRELKEATQDPSKIIFDEDEYKLVKEMPLARSTFYDIKLEAQKKIEKFKDQRNFRDEFNKLLDEYELEEKTKSEIFEFYMKKFKNIFEDNKEMKNLNCINIEKYSDNDKKLMDKEKNLINIGEHDKRNNHIFKINNTFEEAKNGFKKKLEDEDNI